LSDNCIQGRRAKKSSGGAPYASVSFILGLMRVFYKPSCVSYWFYQLNFIVSYRSNMHQTCIKTNHIGLDYCNSETMNKSIRRRRRRGVRAQANAFLPASSVQYCTSK